MRFTDWLLNKPHQRFISDLAGDVRDDTTWPRKSDADLESLGMYLVHNNACSRAQDALERAFRRWKKETAA